MFKIFPQKSNSQKTQITLLHTLAISFKSTNLFIMSGQSPVHRPPDKKITPRAGQFGLETLINWTDNSSPFFYGNCLLSSSFQKRKWQIVPNTVPSPRIWDLCSWQFFCCSLGLRNLFLYIWWALYWILWYLLMMALAVISLNKRGLI